MGAVNVCKTIVSFSRDSRQDEDWQDERSGISVTDRHVSRGTSCFGETCPGQQGSRVCSCRLAEACTVSRAKRRSEA